MTLAEKIMGFLAGAIILVALGLLIALPIWMVLK